MLKMRTALLLVLVVLSEQDRFGQAGPSPDTRGIDEGSKLDEQSVRQGMFPVVTHAPNYNYVVLPPQGPMFHTPFVLQPVKHGIPGRPTLLSRLWEFYLLSKIIRNFNVNRKPVLPTVLPGTRSTSARSRFDFTEWHRSRNGCRYKLYKEKEDFLTSKSLCEAVGARLAVKGMRGVDDAATQIRNDILVVTETINAGFDTWIGVWDFDGDEIFVWIDGVVALKTGPNQNTAWKDNEPTGGDRSSCGRVNQHDITIFDERCGTVYYRLCEYCPDDE